jgi:hypothetical protein
MYYSKSLYIFFIVLALNIFFFSTTCLKANPFLINEIEISEKLENNFNKDLLINKGFERAFSELISKLVKSKDLKKIKDIRLNKIKGMIDSFSVKEEKFVNKTYYLNLGVSFNKKKVFNYLEKKNVFPSQIISETFIFIPIIFNQEENDLLVFSNNPIYKNWNTENKKEYLIDYLLPTEDLEDFKLIKEKSSNIENYDFQEIIKKYFLKHSIVALIFKDREEIKVLSKITIKEKSIIKNNSFKNFNFNDEKKIQNLIDELKIIYEDIWKDQNQINTSIKLPLLIQVDNKDLNISLKFEKNINEVDLINSYSIKKFNKNNILYEIIFNGTPKKFINIMKNKDYSFDTQKKVWILK